MILKNWEELPQRFKNDAVKEYYDILKHKKASLILKRAFDIVMSLLLLIILSPLFLILAIVIKLDSKGPVFYRQERVTMYGKRFMIHKFRSMVENAEQIGASLTVEDDKRITRAGKFIRKFRLDEICQLIDVLSGNMTFVGTRPEVVKYVEKYTDEMMATLLLPAGITSMASILYLDEDVILRGAADVDKTYIDKVLPEKMKYNLDALKKIGFFGDIKIMFMTVAALFGKDYPSKKEK